MKRTMTILALLLLAAGCSGSDLAPAGRNGVVTDPAAQEEAELAALWLSGDVTAPEDLTSTIHDDLAAIRTAYPYPGGDVNTSIRFRTPWVPTMLGVHFTDEAKARIREGTYYEFYELNHKFGVTDIDTSNLWLLSSVWLHFNGYVNPLALSLIYEALDGVTRAGPNYYAGDGSCVYPWKVEGGMTYLFRSASGDCLAGCMRSTFWYFRVPDGGDIEYVGSYESDSGIVPSWWHEAKTAYDNFRGFGG